MNLEGFSLLNKYRCIDKDGFNHPLEEWSVAEWTNAMAGEAGEAANVAKKIIRLRSAVKLMNKISDTPDELKDKLSQELSDTIIYADLCFHRIGRDAATEVIKTFNRKSKEMGLGKNFIYDR